MALGLWSVIEEHSERTTLTNLAMNGRSSPECDVSPRYILGINASRWVYDSQLYHHSKSRVQRPELEILFRRLGALLQSPVIPLFVFDASDKPETMLDRLLKVNLKITAGLRQLIIACGYPWYDAPGLAEAELARLNVEKIVDAVISEDGRAILFGARTVLYNRGRDLFGEGYGRDIAVYRVPALMEGGLSPQSRGSLLLHYLLAGLVLFPPEIAAALASDGLGDNFLNAVTSLRGKALERRLHALRHDLRTAVVRLRKLVPRLQSRRIVDEDDCVVPDTFPYFPRRADKPKEYVEDIRAFTVPITSWSSEDKGRIPTRDVIVLSTPDLALLTTRCEQLLGWDDEYQVCSEFRSWIWNGIFTREVQACTRTHHGAAIQNDSDVSLTAVRISGKRERSTTEFLVHYDPSRYAAVTRSTLLSLCPVSSSSIVATPLDEDEPSKPSQKVALGGIWVPAPVLKRACAALVDQYEGV